MLDKKVLKLLDLNFPDFAPITNKTRKENKQRIFTGGVRINIGNYRSEQEDRDYREKVTALKFPY